ncbi:2-isopropylmalate synthase [Flavobacterium undicola]|uniref:2-isopropylmalate synthase n=1 Tax=Flavobacterium undicola TaxID=1932779 RepID=UPI001377E978|nr:2-isopropylmalate synthase [Flavobacterium undicola]MBA0882489.1 2-isopropylmalate synthase [Flavobacterium undicola]
MTDRIYIFDTTLRDAEQTPGCQLSSNEKVLVAEQLEMLGVDIIEAGFAISSPMDFNSIIEISKNVNKPIICSLARAVEKDILAAADSLKYAKRKRIHTGIGVSDMHIKNKLRTTRENIIDIAVKSVKLARNYVDDVQFYAEDTGRADLDFLASVCDAVIRAGATVINLPDTNGYATPEEYGNIIKFLINNVSNIDKVTLSAHSHNDLGLATANSYSAILNGARQVECTINGLGERAGNSALEEIVMLLKVRESNKYITKINTKKIFETSMLVSKLMKSPIQSNKAIVGRNAFAHSSGIHQDGIIKDRNNYEIIDPELVGAPLTSLVLSARSGKAALNYKLEALGFSLSKDELALKYDSFLKIADNKSTVNENDLLKLMNNKHNVDSSIKIVSVNYSRDEKSDFCESTIVLQLFGKEESATAKGNGPVDASIQSINKILKKDILIEHFLIQGITNGASDTCLVSMTIKVNNGDSCLIYNGDSSSTDIVLASVNAYINALNKI